MLVSTGLPGSGVTTARLGSGLGTAAPVAPVVTVRVFAAPPAALAAAPAAAAASAAPAAPVLASTVSFGGPLFATNRVWSTGFPLTLVLEIGRASCRER